MSVFVLGNNCSAQLESIEQTFSAKRELVLYRRVLAQDAVPCIFNEALSLQKAVSFQVRAGRSLGFMSTSF